MNAFIYTGGTVWREDLIDAPKENDLIVTADSGFYLARDLGLKPDAVIGDFDSCPPPPEGDWEYLRYPSEKDDTDTQLAVKYALSRGATHLTVVGGLEGRLDHTLSALSILEMLLHRYKMHAVYTNGANRVQIVENDSLLVLREGYRYLSILAVSEKLKGVTVEGCKYPLKKQTLTRENQYAVSNELVGNAAFIEIKKGCAFIIESK